MPILSAEPSTPLLTKHWFAVKDLNSVSTVKTHVCYGNLIKFLNSKPQKPSITLHRRNLKSIFGCGWLLQKGAPEDVWGLSKSSGRPL